MVLFMVALAPAAEGQYSDLLRIPDTITARGRICFALYTVHENILKLTAQFYPINNYEPFEASLQIKSGDDWLGVDTARIDYPGYTARFRVEDWDDSRETEYRVAYNNTAFYTGIVRKNPVDKEEFVLAAFTGNAIYPQHGGDISKLDIVKNLKRIKPDLLFFSGDQVYDHSAHLLYWLKFGRDFGEIIRNTPTICIPDDHDIGQGNLWGSGGSKRAATRNGSTGGYYMPVSYIREVERAQTSNLPDPFDPAPIGMGIGVYYTDLKWGGISFAILEDRKFKTGPDEAGVRELRSRSKGKETDPVIFDLPGTTLLGERQLDFLRSWTTDWKDAEMKAVLSQTIFAQSANYGGRGGGPIRIDFDSNGWPQTGRNKALEEIRKSYACMIAGDQHLGSVIHHGIDHWNDAGYSFCVPSIANYWLRWWRPEEPGKNRQNAAPEYTGEFLDGFHNKITVHAVANPDFPPAREGGKLTTRAAGFGVIRFHKPDRTITFECWGRNVDITGPTNLQYDGWPVTISQLDNYSMENGLELPVLKVSHPDQVITITESKTGEIVSSVRIKGTKHHPKVPRQGLYDILIGEEMIQKQLTNVESGLTNRKVITVTLD